MAGEDRELFDEEPEGSLARELMALRPYAQRQAQAQSARPDPAFARSLRLRLVGAPVPVPLFERLARVIATLVPPPAPRMALAGTRAAGGAPPPLTYEAGEVQVSLSVETAPDGTVAVRGMLISTAHDEAAMAGSKAELTIDGQVVAAAPLDEFGLFTLETVPAGDYSLELALPDRVIVIPGIALGR